MSAEPRQPTEAEREQEKAVLYPWYADCAFIVVFVVLAVMTGSLTVISECVRGTLLLGTTLYGYWVMRQLHRNRLRRFEYGIGKLEQFVAVVTGLALIVSGLWVANSVIAAVVTGQQAASPFGLAAAAATNAVNTLINVLGWYGMLITSRKSGGEVFKTQLRARATMMVGSLVIQVTMTAAALAKDPDLALLFDAAGAIFIVGLMLLNGTRMLVHALPDLLDSPAPGDLGDRIRDAAAGVIPAETVLWVRTRRSGRTVFTEIAVSADPAASVTTLMRWRAAIEDLVAGPDAAIEVSILPIKK